MIVRERKSWFHLLFLWHGSVFADIWLRVLLVTGVAAGVVALHRYLGLFRGEQSPTPFTVVGLALSIFLGFRNSTAYDRFWEGRRLWGRLINSSRNLARQITSMLTGPDAEALRSFQRRFLYHTIAFAHCLRKQLRGQDTLAGLEPLLDEKELASLRAEPSRPFALVRRMGGMLAEARSQGWLDRLQWNALDAQLSELSEVQGGCERIRETPLPFPYTVLLHRTVAAYCLALPFGIVDKTGLATPLVALLVTYAFFGLDALGDEIEDPFGLDPNDLPIAALSRKIEVNLRATLGESDLPELLKPEDSVLL